MDGCANFGAVYGRKDVGGIVGQMEPYLHLSLRDDLISRLRSELDTLNSLINSTLDDIDRISSSLSTRLKSVSSYTSAAVDNADVLADRTTDFIDKNVAGINELTDRVDYALDAMPSILKSLEGAADRTDDALAALEQCNRDLTMDAADRSRLTGYSDSIQRNSQTLSNASYHISEDVELLRSYLTGSSSWDTDAVFSALADLLNHLSDATGAMSAIAKDLAGAAGVLTRYLQNSVPKAHSDIETALSAARGAVSYLNSAVNQTRKLTEDLNSREDVTFSELGQDYRDTLTSLFDNLRGTVSELDALNDELSSDSSALTADLRAVNAQMSVVVNLFLDVFLDVENADASDIFEDTSDEDIEAVSFGKVRGSVNSGIVQGDLNVGGVAGAMSIEYELDPEDDLKQSPSVLNRVYETKAVMQRCVNRGEVTAKKDCAGGIVGQMELGIAVHCEAYGSVKSETGSYVGGIAGLSSAVIRSCWSKCTLSGTSGVGGIVGSGGEGSAASSGCSVTDCRSLVQISDCEQFAGAISGCDRGSFRGNLFVSDTLRGIDRRSLSGQAEPVDYETLVSLDGAPEDFLRFTLKFVNDDVTLKSLSFDYGASFDLSVYPSLTDREGSYPVWDRTDLTDLRFDTVVTAEYVPYLTALQGDSVREDGRPVFFVEGQFRDGDALRATAQTPQPDEFPQLADSRHTALKNYFSFLSERTLPAMSVYRSVVEQWELSFPRDALASHTVRYLSPSGSPDGFAVFVRQADGSWSAVETETMGSYLLFTVEDCDVQVAVLTTAAVWWLWALFLTVVAALILFALRAVRRRAKPRKAKKAIPSDSEASVGSQPDVQSPQQPGEP